MINNINEKEENMGNTGNGRTDEWILTDSDSFQIRRSIRSANDACKDVFELYQITQTKKGWEPDDERLYGISHAIVFLDQAILESIPDCYGFQSLEQFKAEYAGDWKEVLAEYVFEDSALEYTIQPAHTFLTWKEAKELICTLSGYQEQDRLMLLDPFMRFMTKHRVLRIGLYDLRLSDADTVVMTDTATGRVWTFTSKKELDELIIKESLPLVYTTDADFQ